MACPGSTAADYGLSVLLTSHVVAELPAIADYLVVLAAGRVAVAGDVTDLLAAHRMLTGPAERLPVIVVLRAARQAHLLVRSAGPFPPCWQVREVGLDELVLSYLGRPTRAGCPDRRRWSGSHEHDRRVETAATAADDLGDLAAAPAGATGCRRRRGLPAGHRHPHPCGVAMAETYICPTNGTLCVTTLAPIVVAFGVAAAWIALLHAVPGLIGMFVGAPLLAREFELGTAPFVWCQGITPLRWTVAKLVLVAVLLWHVHRQAGRTR